MNPRHRSESNEHYTPKPYVEAARTALGRIDLDPATCELAQRIVRAERHYAEEHDGFTRVWSGRVFLNPPGGQSDRFQRRVEAHCTRTGSCGLPAPHRHQGVEPNQTKWWFKLAREHKEGRVPEAVFVAFSVELVQTTQADAPWGLPLPLDFAIAYPRGRVAYDTPGAHGDRVPSKSPPHASAFVYLGDRVDAFAQAFRPWGKVVIPRDRFVLGQLPPPPYREPTSHPDDTENRFRED